MIRRRLISASAAFVAAAPFSVALGARADHARAIRNLEEGVALVLAEHGFAAYEALFDPDYVNWPNGGALLSRSAFLEGVRRWYDAGNRAVAAQLIPVSLDIAATTAHFRYRLREDFNDGTSFIGDFISAPRFADGSWRFHRTSFFTRYRGKSEDAPLFPEIVSAVTR